MLRTIKSVCLITMVCSCCFKFSETYTEFAEECVQHQVEVDGGEAQGALPFTTGLLATD